MYPKHKMCKTINYWVRANQKRINIGLFDSDIAYIWDRNGDFSCPLYPLVKYLFGVDDVHILKFTDRLHSLKKYYAHRN